MPRRRCRRLPREVARLRSSSQKPGSEARLRTRNLLRPYHIDGLTIDQLAALYQVNRATAARWVAGARLAVVTATRDRLVESLGVQTSEVDSSIRLVRSQLELSVRELSPRRGDVGNSA